MSPIDKLLKENFINQDDARIDFWTQLQREIKEGKHALVWNKILSHRYDIDYHQQLELVAREIVWQDENQ